MTNPRPLPNNPAGWLAYAKSEDVTSIPQRADQKNDRFRSLLRDVYVEASTALLPPPDGGEWFVYTDILAFKEREINIPRSNRSIAVIIARVFTADAPVNITIPSDTDLSLWIYASIVDQPITVSIGGWSVVLELGPESEYGVRVWVTAGESGVDPLIRQRAQDYWDSELTLMKDCLNTQLRIAFIQFWKNPSIAISLCSHVAAWSAVLTDCGLLNTQAVALGTQATGRLMAGSDMSYAPILVLSRYKETMSLALQAATAFEQQFERFQDKKESLENQILAWDTMISQAKSKKSLHMNLYDNSTLESQSEKFKEGIKKWKIEQETRAAFEIFSAITGFAVGIGELSLGNPGGGAAAGEAVESAVENVSKIERLVGQIGKILTSDTFKKIRDCVNGLDELRKLMQKIVGALKAFQVDPSVKIPSTDTISGTRKGDVDAAAIVTMAAWDKWILESDDQMKFGVQQGIEGASGYQLALRKHAVNGKQLAQAQTEAVKAGYEYAQAQMEVNLSDQQINDLTKLKDGYKGKEEHYAQAEAMFYDRVMALRHNVIIALQNMTWAYRYWALAESSVVLEVQKCLADYDQDLSTISYEMEDADSRYSTDFQPFEYPIESKNLPAGFGTSMIDGLKVDRHTGSFTLVPGGNLAGGFTEGFHYRISGVDPTLRGVLPNPAKMDDDGEVKVRLQITTSGIYADINENKKVFQFHSIPQVRRCTYTIDRHGVRGKTLDNPTFDTKDHAEPTPFTQWSIKLLNPDDLILDGLEEVDMVWSGHAGFSKEYKLD